MPSLVDPDPDIRPVSAQPTLCSGGERCSLAPGRHALGGRGADALPLTALESQPRAATLTVADDGSATLQRTTASVVVRIDGETIGISPVALHHGARIEFGECRLLFESSHSAPTPRVTGSSERRAPTRPDASSNGDRATAAALVDARTGQRHPLAGRRLVIGRDESCDVVVHGNSVSRRHASVAPVAGGFMLRDESANGTLVNGVRVVGTYLLGNGDVIRLHDDELRVELDPTVPAAVVHAQKTTLLDLAHIRRGTTEEQARASATRAPKASLEIVRGPFAGACFQVERAVCSIGRGEESDVRVRDDTVSTTHATLLRKQGAWFVVDLRSMNGTFVDGSRVSGERELHPGACVRVGAVELVFRSIDAAEQAIAGSPRRSVWQRLRAVLRSLAPPTGGP
jgi:pSer/pThr/pTyr-binding forkhead associated (FHA) protein